MSITTVDNNYLIHYEVLGRGKPLILVHGWLGSWRYWWPSMQELARAHRVFAFDLWGFGNSSKVQSKYTFDAYVEMLAQLLDKLGIYQPVTLVGHALGAAVALRFASQNPDAVHRLAAVALPIQGKYIHDRLMTSDSSSFVQRVLNKGNDYPEVESELLKSDPAAVNSLANQLRGYDFATDLEKCVCPVLLISGNRDPVIQQPAADYAIWQNAQGNRHYVTLDGCAHFPMLEETATFNRLLLDFIHADKNATEIAPKELWRRRTR